MTDAKVLLIVKNVDMELLEKLQKVIVEHNVAREKRRLERNLDALERAVLDLKTELDKLEQE